MVAAKDVKKLKVQELKDELDARKLDTSGLKAALVERLEAAIGAEEAGEPAGTAADAEGAAAPAEPAGDTGAAGAGDDEAGKPAEQADGEAAPEAATVASAQAQPSAEAINAAALTEDERRKLRAQRFGGKADGSVSALGKMDVAEEIGKRKDRAKRFGLPVPVFAAEFCIDNLQEEAKKKSRAERFNLPKSKAELDKEAKAKAAALAAELAEKKRQRGERFGTLSEEDKAAQRAKRFAAAGAGGAPAKTPAGNGAASTADDLQAKLKARAARFAAATT